MKVIQGFVVVPHLINNSAGTIAPIGELSTYSRTFTKEKGEYRHGDYPEYQLVTFTSTDADTAQLVTLNTAEVEEIFRTVRGKSDALGCRNDWALSRTAETVRYCNKNVTCHG
mgnify:CR=1 FL=1